MPIAPDLKPACAHCRYWDSQEPTPGDELIYGLCRRYPPDADGWPGTTPNDWCGEFADASPSSRQGV